MPIPTACEPILVVEDDPDIRSGIVAGLQATGFRVIEATGVEDATDLLDRGMSPPVVVTDINLGASDLDGLALADEVHRTHPDVPVVFITGRLDMLRARGLKRGEFVVPKPFPLAALTSVVRRYVTAQVTEQVAVQATRLSPAQE